MNIRKATAADIDGVCALYRNIHTAEEQGLTTTGWKRDIYPLRSTAEAALERDDLFVMEEEGRILGTAILNQLQVGVYASGTWQYDVPDSQVMVMHTLAIEPSLLRMGYGKAFERYYEQYALENGCPYLRIDTNANNVKARAFYKALHYREIGIVPCTFNGLKNVDLVLLEKKLN